MRQLKWSALILFLIALAPCLAPAQMMHYVAPGEVREFQISAKKYQFDPFLVIVRPGDKVRLTITAIDRDYTFQLKKFHIREKLVKGVPTVVNFTASEEGKFTFRCPELECRSVHSLYGEMKGKVVVRPTPAELPSGLPPGVKK